MRMGLKKSHKVRKRNTSANKSQRRNRKRTTARRHIRGGMPGKTGRSTTSRATRVAFAEPYETTAPPQRSTRAARSQSTTAAPPRSTTAAVRRTHMTPLPNPIDIEYLPNSKLADRDPFADPLSYANGPDRHYMKEYGYLERFFRSPDNQRKNNSAYKDFEKVQRNIGKRQGQVRSKEGAHLAFEFPSSSPTPTIAPLNLDHRLKIVVVQRKNEDHYIVLMTNAYMENYNYAGEHILKWTDTDPNGHVTIRKHKKHVEHINPRRLQEIEDWGREEHGYTYPPWGMLLGMKTEYPEEYNRIITEYFVENGKFKPADLGNILFLDTINEISHSAIPYMYHEQDITTDSHGVPLVFIGAEGVFYMDDYGKLCFIICNLSGHYKTPPERMPILKNILVRDYGYNASDLILLYPPPPPPSSQDSYDSDASEPREDYRRFITNDSSMTFELAELYLSRSMGNNAQPVIGPFVKPYSYDDPDEPEEYSNTF